MKEAIPIALTYIDILCSLAFRHVDYFIYIFVRLLHNPDGKTLVIVTLT